jgi:hypothetical protein
MGAGEHRTRKKIPQKLAAVIQGKRAELGLAHQLREIRRDGRGRSGVRFCGGSVSGRKRRLPEQRDGIDHQQTEDRFASRLSSADSRRRSGPELEASVKRG